MLKLSEGTWEFIVEFFTFMYVWIIYNSKVFFFFNVSENLEGIGQLQDC